MEKRISGHTRLLALIGSPVGHSGSPAMYNYSFEKLGLDYAYVAFDIKEDGTLSDEKMSPNVVDDKYMLYEGDILFARSGATVGKTYLYNNKDGKSIYAGYLIRFVADTNIVIPKYIYYYTLTTYYKAFNFLKKNYNLMV